MDVDLDILKAINKGEKKPTRIIQKANINWTRLVKAIDYLLFYDFIERKIVGPGGRCELKITNNGKDFLKILDKKRGR